MRVSGYIVVYTAKKRKVRCFEASSYTLLLLHLKTNKQNQSARVVPDRFQPFDAQQ